MVSNDQKAERGSTVEMVEVFCYLGSKDYEIKISKTVYLEV